MIFYINEIISIQLNIYFCGSVDVKFNIYRALESGSYALCVAAINLREIDFYQLTKKSYYSFEMLLKSLIAFVK